MHYHRAVIVSSVYKGKGQAGVLNYDMNIGAGETKDIVFFVAGSYTSEEELNKTYREISDNYAEMLQNKKERYEALYNPFESTLKKLTKQEKEGFDKWNEWYRKEGKKRKDW